MSNPATDYFQEFAEGFGRGWNRFWYTPSDPYALGVIRVAVGLLALYFQLTYTPDLGRFFADGGLLPTSVTRDWYGGQDNFNPGELSYLSHLHTLQELQVAHALGAAVLALMTIGLLSRITTVLGFYVVFSYIQRAPMITGPLENVLAMLMFYLCFGPTGAALSVDRWWARRRAGQNTLAPEKLNRRYASATIVTRLIQIHITVVCLMMGLAMIQRPSLLRSEGNIEWQDPWGSGAAVWQLIARPLSPSFDLRWLQSHTYVINLWTYAIMVFQLTFAVLVWNRLARPLLLGLSVVVWGSLALISGMAPLSVAMLIGNLAFFSPDFLRRVTGGGTTPAPAAQRSVS